jgi:hypothetical protein
LKSAFENISLSFHYHGREVNGILQGSPRFWTFSSNSEAFLKIIPSGKLYNNARWVEPIRYEALDFYQAICNAGEKMGLQMEKDDE